MMVTVPVVDVPPSTVLDASDTPVAAMAPTERLAVLVTPLAAALIVEVPLVFV